MKFFLLAIGCLLGTQVAVAQTTTIDDTFLTSAPPSIRTVVNENLPHDCALLALWAGKEALAIALQKKYNSVQDELATQHKVPNAAQTKQDNIKQLTYRIRTYNKEAGFLSNNCGLKQSEIPSVK